MLRVWSDLLLAADIRQVTLLGLLDLSAAFDCVHHDLLLQRLQLNFGLTDVVLNWIRSFLADRTLQVAYDGKLSATQALRFAVPQGSVLGPLLYVLCTAELSHVVARHGMRLHQYADDIQLYISVPVHDTTLAVQRFSACVADVNEWLRASRLLLNATKTQVMWLGSPQQVSHVDVSHVPVLSELIEVVETARDLGVVIDSQLSLSAHVAMLCRSGFYHLRQLRPIARSLSTEAAKTLVHAFISSRLDYCNSLLFGVPDVLLRKVQSVQNAAARLVTGAKRRDHITPVLQQLHWLSVRRRIEFKIACLVHQSLSGRTPTYLAADIQLVVDRGRQNLRSASDRTCFLPRTHNTFGDRSFSVAGPRVWNSLPADLRRELQFGAFRRQLKTVLFSR